MKHEEKPFLIKLAEAFAGLVILTERLAEHVEKTIAEARRK